MTDINTKEANSKEAKVVHDLTADLAALREDFSKLSGAVREMLQAQATSTTRRVIGAVDDARHKLSDDMVAAKGQFESQIGAVSADLESAIERSPLVAVMIGAAVGFVLGLVMRPQR